jgi:hypothetical protein
MTEPHPVDVSELEHPDPTAFKVSDELAVEIVGMNKWFGQPSSGGCDTDKPVARPPRPAG